MMILRFSSSTFGGILLLSVTNLLPKLTQANEACSFFTDGSSPFFDSTDLAPIEITTDPGLCLATISWPQIELDFDEDSTVNNDPESDGCCGTNRRNRRRQREVRAAAAAHGRHLSRNRQLEDINIRNTGSIQFPGGTSSFVQCDDYQREYIVIDDEPPVILNCPDGSVLPYEVPMADGECYYDGSARKKFGTLVVTDNCGVENLMSLTGDGFGTNVIDRRDRKLNYNKHNNTVGGASSSSSSPVGGITTTVGGQGQGRGRGGRTTAESETRNKQRSRSRNRGSSSSSSSSLGDGTGNGDDGTLRIVTNNTTNNGPYPTNVENPTTMKRKKRDRRRKLQENLNWGLHIVNEIELDEDVGGGGTIHTKLYAYQDENGNRVECPIRFVAIDDQKPDISCPTNPIQVDANNCDSAYYEPAEPSFDDNCGINGLVVTNDFPTDKIFPIGTNTYHYYIVDAAGNKNSCEVVIEVLPFNENNEIAVTCPNSATGSDTCNGSTGLSNEPALVNDPGLCGKVVNYQTDLEGDFSFDYRCDDLCVDLTHESGTFFPARETVTVTYTATDSDGDTGSCSFDIEVRDAEPPVITECPKDVQVENEEGECTGIVEWCSPIAHDNCAGELGFSSVASSTSQICGVLDDVKVESLDSFPVGTTTVTHFVFDESGNIDSCQQQVEVIDTEPPTFPKDGCPSDWIEDAVSDCSATVMYTVRATDNCAGLGGNVKLENLTPQYWPGAKFPHGEHNVRWSATDLAGNVAYCEFTVTVVDNIDLDPGSIDCDTEGIIPVKGTTTISPTYPPKENGCPTFTQLSCPTCQMCAYEGATFDLAASQDCGLEISSGTLEINNAGDIGTFISAQVVITDLEGNTKDWNHVGEVAGTCTVCVDDGRRRRLIEDDERKAERPIEQHRRTRRGGHAALLGGKNRLLPSSKGKGSEDYNIDTLEDDGCHEPVLGSTQFLGSVSQCGRRSESSGKGSSKGRSESSGKGSSKGESGSIRRYHEWYCPPAWDPLNNQFACEMNPNCEVVLDPIV